MYIFCYLTDRNSFNGSKGGKSLTEGFQVEDEKLETKAMNNSLKQVCCKGKEQGDRAVGQEAPASLLTVTCYECECYCVRSRQPQMTLPWVDI